MYNCVAFIPTRKGSKGIPGKNIKNFCGQPLLKWTHDQAEKSKTIEAIFHWTDYDIRSLWENPFEKPTSAIKRLEPYCGDDSLILSGITTAVHDMLYENHIGFETKIVFLQATSPLRMNHDIDAAINEFDNQPLMNGITDPMPVVSGVKIPDACTWDKNTVEPISIYPKYEYDPYRRGSRTSRKTLFIENGSIYVFTPKILFNRGNYATYNSRPYSMQLWQLKELDELWDWFGAEKLMSKMILEK